MNLLSLNYFNMQYYFVIQLVVLVIIHNYITFYVYCLKRVFIIIICSITKAEFELYVTSINCYLGTLICFKKIIIYKNHKLWLNYILMSTYLYIHILLYIF